MNRSQKKQESLSTRIVWVDIAKALGIVFVVLNHLECNTEEANAIYSPFFLSIFFFVSGYVYTHRSGFFKFFNRKIIQLFIPWLLYSILQIFLSVFLSFNEHMPFWEEMLWNILQIRGCHDGMWFVAALFVTFIPFYYFIGLFLKCSTKNKLLLCGLSLVLFVVSQIYTNYMDPNVFPWGSANLPWHIEYIPVGIFYMLLGFLFRHNWESIYDRIVRGNIIVILIIFYLVLALLDLFVLKSVISILKIFYGVCLSLIGLTCVIAVCKSIKANRFLQFIGRNSLNYFGMHGKVYSLVQFLLHKTSIYYLILGNKILTWVLCIPFALFICFLLISPSIFVNRWIPILSGKGFASKKNNCE